MERETRREKIEMLIWEERRESYCCLRGVNLKVDSAVPVNSDRGEAETGGDRRRKQ